MGFFKFIGNTITNSVKYNIEQQIIKSRSYVCNKCNYKWMSKKSFGEPAICPKCKKQNISKIYKE